MKRTYTKPTILLESFTLTQSIASDCGPFPANGSLGTPSSADKYSCGWDMMDFTIWADGINPDCNSNMGVTNDTEISGVCYNNPNGGLTIFGS